MLIHYVEDSDTDVRAMRRILRNDPDLDLDVSSRIDQLAPAAAIRPIDLLLIDVRRPESVSLEADVTAAREATAAPILFLTGLDPDSIRERALSAGADAVIQKGSLTSGALRQFADNARARLRVREALAEIAAPQDQPDPPVRASVEEFDGPLAFVQDGLRILIAREHDAAWRQRGDLTRSLHETIRRVRRAGAQRFEETVECDAAAALAALRPTLQAAADARGVDLALDLEPDAWFTAIGAVGDAQSGLAALALGLVEAAGAGDRLALHLAKSGDAAALHADGDRALVSGAAEILGLTPPARRLLPRAAQVTLQCGAALLALREQQIVISSDGRRVTFHL